MPNVRVSEDVYRRLKEIKERMHHSSMSDTIDYLISVATSPQHFIESAAFWLEDVRSDVKDLKRLIERLEEALLGGK